MYVLSPEGIAAMLATMVAHINGGQ
jgi:hypothetical protein